MAYSKKKWVSNEVITAPDLNRMEDGIDNAYNKVEKLLTEMDISNELREAALNLITQYTFSFKNSGNTLKISAQ